MPNHILLAHVAALTAPVVALMAVVYALVPGSRRGLRWPLVAGSLLAAVLLVWTGSEGHVLLDELHAAGSPEYPAAYRHAKNSDGVTSAAVLLAIVAPLAGLRFLKPSAAKRPLTIAGIVLAIAALALAITAGFTVLDGVSAAWTSTR